MDSDVIYYAAYLLLHDLPFVKEHGARFSPAFFPKGPLRGLTAIALEQGQIYRRTTTAQVLDLCLTNGFRPDLYGTTADELRYIFGNLEPFVVDDNLRPRIIPLILEWVRLRRIGMAADEALDATSRGQADDAALALRGAREPAVGDDAPLRLSQDFNLALGDLPDNAIPTGFRTLDSLWSGGIRPGEFGVILSPTNVGKTQTLCYLAAVAYKSSHPCVYYTFELAKKMILRRITSAVLRKSVQTIPVDDAPALLERVRINRQITNADIEIRSGGMGVADLLMDLEELEEEGRKPHVILLDSADDLVATRQHQSEYQRLGEIYMDVRNLALAADIAIWTSTQATREAIDKARISLKHMGDSFWKARRAHYVLGLSQTEQERNEPFGPYMSLYILKDSEHGSPGRHFVVRPAFGQGGKGYPGFEEVDKNALP